MSDPIRISEIKFESGELRIIPVKKDLPKAMALIRKLKNRMYDLEIKEHREKRSLDANAYAWVLIGKLADKMRISPTEVYLEAVKNVGGNFEIIPIKEGAAEKFKKIWSSQGIGWPCDDLGPCNRMVGYRYIRAFYGSSSFDTRQMSILIDNLVQDCKALDIETLSPEKLSAMVDEWNA